MEASPWKNLEQLEFSLDSVIDLSSPSAPARVATFSYVDGVTEQSDSTHCFTFDLASAQLFKFGTVEQFMYNDNSEEKSFSQGVNIKFGSDKDSKEYCDSFEEWRKDALVQVSASKSKFDHKIEASSAKMYYGQLLQQQNMLLQDYVRTGTYYAAVMENRSDFAGGVVVHVVAGSGILSMFAAQAGAKHVYAVRASQLAEYARKLIAGNPLFADRITVIKGKVEAVADVFDAFDPRLLVAPPMFRKRSDFDRKGSGSPQPPLLGPYCVRGYNMGEARNILELSSYQSAPTRRSEGTDVSFLMDPPHLSTRLSHILRRLLGSRTRSLVGIAALFSSVAVAKARSSPGSSTDSRVDALLSVMGDFGYNKLLADTWIGNDPCDKWCGVDCMDGQIRAITLMFMNLTGSISPRFADLTSLYVIDLSYNLLTGTIPLELTKMELRNLDLSYNRLHGRVPHFKTLVPNTKGNPEILSDVASRSGHHTLAWILSGGFGALCFLIGAGICFFRAWKRNRSGRASQPAQNEMVPQSQQNKILESGNNAFSLEILREATQDFSVSVGTGRSGSVYQGKLKDGREIAVKKIDVADGKGYGFFDTELSVLSRVRHRNIVSLHGYCIEGDERLLVYELMAHGALSKHLRKEDKAERLDWSRRLVIALDVARGLEYLHTLASQSQIYIHRDVKSANVLLGEDLRAKIGDFGSASATTEDREPIKTTCVGTLGYMAPEYFDGEILSRKADVYSFGVILLEIMSGKKAYNTDDANRSEDVIAMWFEKKKDDFWQAVEEEEDIGTDYETQQSVQEVAELAGSCCATEAERRPEMSQIVRVLSSLIEIRDRRNQASSSGS
ncbi:unnamed protein product [Brassica rapa subsp. trilocularis]